MRRILLGFLLLASAFPAAPPELHVAAAANLGRVLDTIGAAFEHKTGVHIVPSLGATAQLTQQLENGAPFDVFLSADTEHVDQLIAKHMLLAESRAIYARGELVVWAPRHPEIRTLDGLAKPGVHTIAIAKPELAPYGAAAIEVLKAAHLWERLETKVVYAPSIATAKQYADTGNAEAAFTALALTTGEKGNSFPVDAKLHKPIDQALGIVTASKEVKNARAFTAFLASPKGRAILKQFGYSQP